MGLKEDMDKAVCMAGKMEFEYKLREVVNSVQIAVGVELAQCKRQLYKVVQKLDILESIPVEEGKTKFQFE